MKYGLNMTDISNLNTITIIGAGTMGREIAQVCLMGGFKHVIIYDINQEALEDAFTYIKDGLEKIESKGKLDEGVHAKDLINYLAVESDLKNAVKDSDFIIEAIPEIMDLKQYLILF